MHLIHLYQSPSGWIHFVYLFIQLLRKTFHKATAVLVLDRELEIVQSATVPFLELGLHIHCGGWVKCLWTLQEATLASEAYGTDKLYFQMQDGPFLYEKYDRDRKALNSLDEAATKIEAEDEQIPCVQAMHEMREGWSPFQVIHSTTEHPSTSRFKDVLICIASLLGKDITMIVPTSDAEQRMANLYMLMCKVPIGVLWCLKSEKLTKTPFRWAPKSIASCPPYMTFGGWEDGNIFSQVISDQKSISLGQNQNTSTNAVIVAVEDTVQLLSDDGVYSTEYVCTIVGHVDMLLLQLHPMEMIFQECMTMEDQRWCIT
ncbi:hypothetical protein EDD18DRAFT_1105605 [Armillaria luteobubalina]|uniref:Uncharacterized protein n=1 Tax=Armillaria luteobubalina TaxID=153913 RepID=A0AA39Q717_9AGAR|nr:hypothetical protein EDD18DRAFT_1105605 [Armillaria luteobubalina]